MTHKEAKGYIRAFMREHYTDERLAMLLAHAQEGKLAFDSCCCLIGIPTVDHAALSGYQERGSLHHMPMRETKLGSLTEYAYCRLGNPPFDEDWQPPRSDAVRRRILIPMIRAEIRRRDRIAEAKKAATPLVTENWVSL